MTRIPSKLRNAVASALIADLHTHDLPLTLRAVTQRQVMIANAIARVNGSKTAQILPIVRLLWPMTHGQVPMSSRVESYNHARRYLGYEAEARAMGKFDA